MTKNSPNQTTNETPELVEKRSSVVRVFIVRIMETVPTFIVLIVLTAIAYWGHQTGWKLTKFSELTEASSVEKDDWCPVHNVPESECIICIPTLLPNQVDHGWCKEHGIHQCPLCHPEVAQLKTKPEIEKSRLQTIAHALNIRDRQENNLGCNLYRNRVQFASIDAVNKAGIEIEPAEIKTVVEAVHSNGEITYDETRVAHLSSRVPGIIWNVFRVAGDHVKKGDVLAIIDSAEVGKAKSVLLKALAQVDFHNQTYDRIKPLYDKGIMTGTEFLNTESALQQANIQLRSAEQALVNLGLPVSVKSLKKLSEDERTEKLKFLGIPKAIYSELSIETSSNNLIPLVASIDGIVIHRDAVNGEVIDPKDRLFLLADIRTMWLRFRVKLEDAKYLSVGSSVRFLPDGMQKEISGSLSWISTDVDKKTRTVEVRAEIKNTDGNLRNETFGTGRIILRKTPDSVVVPEEAVQWDGSCFVLFVRDKNYFNENSPKMFHTRTVRPGVSSEGKTEIIAGLLPGEIVATKGSGILRSQILKNNLGAGCTCGQ